MDNNRAEMNHPDHNNSHCDSSDKKKRNLNEINKNVTQQQPEGTIEISHNIDDYEVSL